MKIFLGPDYNIYDENWFGVCLLPNFYHCFNSQLVYYMLQMDTTPLLLYLIPGGVTDVRC